MFKRLLPALSLTVLATTFSIGLILSGHDYAARVSGAPLGASLLSAGREQLAFGGFTGSNSSSGSSGGGTSNRNGSTGGSGSSAQSGQSANSGTSGGGTSNHNGSTGGSGSSGQGGQSANSGGGGMPSENSGRNSSDSFGGGSAGAGKGAGFSSPSSNGGNTNSNTNGAADHGCGGSGCGGNTATPGTSNSTPSTPDSRDHQDTTASRAAEAQAAQTRQANDATSYAKTLSGYGSGDPTSAVHISTSISNTWNALNNAIFGQQAQTPVDTSRHVTGLDGNTPVYSGTALNANDFRDPPTPTQQYPSNSYDIGSGISEAMNQVDNPPADQPFTMDHFTDAEKMNEMLHPIDGQYAPALPHTKEEAARLAQMAQAEVGILGSDLATQKAMEVAVQNALVEHKTISQEVVKGRYQVVTNGSIDAASIPPATLALAEKVLNGTIPRQATDLVGNPQVNFGSVKQTNAQVKTGLTKASTAAQWNKMAADPNTTKIVSKNGTYETSFGNLTKPKGDITSPTTDPGGYGALSVGMGSFDSSSVSAGTVTAGPSAGNQSQNTAPTGNTTPGKPSQTAPGSNAGDTSAKQSTPTLSETIGNIVHDYTPSWVKSIGNFLTGGSGGGSGHQNQVGGGSGAQNTDTVLPVVPIKKPTVTDSNNGSLQTPTMSEALTTIFDTSIIAGWSDTYTYTDGGLQVKAVERLLSIDGTQYSFTGATRSDSALLLTVKYSFTNADDVPVQLTMKDTNADGSVDEFYINGIRKSDTTTVAVGQDYFNHALAKATAYLKSR